MAKITIDDISAQFASTAAINARFQQIEDELNDKVLYRDNPVGEPNVMNNDFDMNSYSILNGGTFTCDALILNGVGVLPDSIAAAPPASSVAITDSGGYYTGTEVETALQEVGSDIATAQADITDLQSLGGVGGDPNLGTFTGTTISDNVAIKVALQEIETAYEETDQNVDDLVTLSGVAENSTDLGTFTGTTISDNTTIKAGMQELETAVEAASTNAGNGSDIYFGRITSSATPAFVSGSQPSGWTVTNPASKTIRVTHNLGTVDYAVTVTVRAINFPVHISDHQSNYFEVECASVYTSVLAYNDFEFVLVT